MTTDVLGEPIKRVEDPRFITGNGHYLDDIKLPSMTHLAILRSPYAHANIRSIDTTAAKAMPGVVAVFVGADIPYNPLPMAWPAGGSAGIQNNVNTPRVARHRQRQVDRRGRRRGRRRDARAGATTRSRLIEVDWEPLPAVVDAEKAIAARRAAAPRERPEQHRVRVDGRRQGRHGRRRRRRGGRRPPADRQPASHPEPDGDRAATSAGTTRAPTSTRSGCRARRRTSSACC